MQDVLRILEKERAHDTPESLLLEWRVRPERVSVLMLTRPVLAFDIAQLHVNNRSFLRRLHMSVRSCGVPL